MQPNTPHQGNRGQVTPPARDHTASHSAAASMTRQQIDKIYSDQARQDAETAQQAATPSLQRVSENSAYNKTHSDDSKDAQQNYDWNHYHSSWQYYYQQYYERFYKNEIHKERSAHVAEKESLKRQFEMNSHLSQGSTSEMKTSPEETVTEKEAIRSLRSELRRKVADNARKVQKSRHFVPLISAATVFVLFITLQYNSLIIGRVYAYTSPGSINQENIIVQPNATVSVSDEPRLIIPKINVDIGVQYENTIGSSAEETNDLQMKAMEEGVAYFPSSGANSFPGQNGNFGIAGHSSNDFAAAGDAKFVFARLTQMKKGDIFYLNYEGTRYTYSVFQTEVVNPDEVSKLKIGGDKPYASLITCVPVGTADNRLLVFGEQISPSPAGAESAPESGLDGSTTEMTGTAPTLLERAFGS